MATEQPTPDHEQGNPDVDDASCTSRYPIALLAARMFVGIPLYFAIGQTAKYFIEYYNLLPVLKNSTFAGAVLVMEFMLAYLIRDAGKWDWQRSRIVSAVFGACLFFFVLVMLPLQFYVEFEARMPITYAFACFMVLEMTMFTSICPDHRTTHEPKANTDAPAPSIRQSLETRLAAKMFAGIPLLFAIGVAATWTIEYSNPDQTLVFEKYMGAMLVIEFVFVSLFRDFLRAHQNGSCFDTLMIWMIACFFIGTVLPLQVYASVGSITPIVYPMVGFIFVAMFAYQGAYAEQEAGAKAHTSAVENMSAAKLRVYMPNVGSADV